MAVPACYASGKTFDAARAAAWWLSTDPEAILISTASVGRSVKNQLWAEIRALKTDNLPGRVMPDAPEWKVSARNFGIGFSTKEPGRFTGWHAPRLLVILDEAHAIPKAIWDAVEGLTTGQEIAVLALGNPSEAAGGFYDVCVSAQWETHRISAFDTPNVVAGQNVIPGMVTKEWIEERREEWGEDSPLWQSKVLGEFPDAGTKTVIPLSWFERALDPPGPRAISEDAPQAGLDIARFGHDFSALAIRKGTDLVLIDRIHGADGVEVAAWTNERLERFGCKHVKGDATGLGGPVLDILRRVPGLKVDDVHAGGKARESDKYVNKRAEMWWGLRLRFDGGLIVLHEDPLIPKLRAEVTAVNYTYDAALRIKIESKEDAAARGVPSPDLGDALCLAFQDYSGPASTSSAAHRQIGGRT